MDHLLYSGGLYSFHIECNTGRILDTVVLVSCIGFVSNLANGNSCSLSLA